MNNKVLGASPMTNKQDELLAAIKDHLEFIGMKHGIDPPQFLVEAIAAAEASCPTTSDELIGEPMPENCHYEYPVVDPTEESDAGVFPVIVPNGFKIVPDAQADEVKRLEEDARRYRERKVAGWLRGGRFIDLPEHALATDTPVFTLEFPAALSHKEEAEIPDNELPGMWEKADFTGGKDEVRGPDWKPNKEEAE
jgi:hypothetical protein